MDLGALVAGKHVMVTGASSGLGEHFARLLARHEAIVSIAARRKDRLAVLAAELRALGSPAVYEVMLDVTDESSVSRALSHIESGEAPPLDILVNNAGIANSQPAIAVATADFDRVIDTNLRGAWLLSNAAVQAWLSERSPGAIVNIASVLGLHPGNGVTPYSISKAGLIQMTKLLALEWARYGIRVNALCPGYVGTDMNAEFFASEAGRRMIDRIPMRRLGDPRDLDGAFLLLASDASAWMTGTTLAVDGGHLVSPL